jgi:hypothetical protein
MGTSEGGKKSLLTKILIAFGVLAVLIQLYRPSRENPVTDPSLAAPAHLGIPPRVAATLRTSCYDCHSNESVWPWYSAIAPASWLVARDVTQGRKRLNFSEWGNYPQSRQVSLLGDIAEEVSKEEMPYPPYLILHPEARLSKAGRDSLVVWANDEQDRLFTQQEDQGAGRE